MGAFGFTSTNAIVFESPLANVTHRVSSSDDRSNPQIPAARVFLNLLSLRTIVT